MTDPAVFQVAFPGEGETISPQVDLLELWQPVATDEPYLTSGEAPGMVWRVNLPDDSTKAGSLLDAHTLALSQTNLALSAAGPLLLQDLRQASGQASARQFAVERASYEFSSSAEGDRVTFLTQALNYQPGGVSFGLQDELAEAAELVSRFTGSLHRLVDRFALVESGRGGRLAARTRVDWLGDVHTWWADGSPAPTITDHQRVLAQALATRQAWLRLAAVLTAGAARVGLAMATGPFNPVAIWAAVQYVQKVLAQYRLMRPAPPGE